MSVAELAGVQPVDRVLDLCAAPGGKSTQLAAAMEGRGLLISNEIHPARAKILSSNIERMGILNAVVTNEAPERLAPHFPAFFDRIVVDAPCSGEGMFRKEEQAVSQWSQDNVDLCAKRQQDILEEAAKMLRSGGVLVYLTIALIKKQSLIVTLIPFTLGGLQEGHRSLRHIKAGQEDDHLLAVAKGGFQEVKGVFKDRAAAFLLAGIAGPLLPKETA